VVNRVTDSILGTTTTKPATMPYSTRKRSRYSRRRPTSAKRRYKRRRTIKKRRTTRGVKTYVGSRTLTRSREYKTCYTHNVSGLANAVGFATITPSGAVRAPYNLIAGITKGTGINQRDRDCVFLKGVRVELEYSNTANNPSTATDEDKEPIYINVAIVIKRNAPKDAPVSADLLRSYGSNRHVSLSTANDWKANTYHAINTDNYLVVMRKRFRLTNRDVWASQELKRSRKMMKIYLKLNTKLDYSTTGDLNSGGLYLCHWYDYEGRYAGKTAVKSQEPQFSLNSIAFFKDIN